MVKHIRVSTDCLIVLVLVLIASAELTDGQFSELSLGSETVILFTVSDNMTAAS